MTGREPQPFTPSGYGDDVPFELMREGWELQVRTDPRVRYFNLGREVDVRDRLASFDGVYLTARGNEMAAKQLATPLIDFVEPR